jgi:DNA repair protein RecN (Recombination protein N)
VIEELRITALGVIEDAVLELGPGLTVVTGETGAGKTMVVTALGLLLGGRADAGAVRAGAAKAAVEGRLVVDPEGVVARRAEEAGAELDDGALLLARSVSAEGRSRAHVGGRSVPVGVLAELGEDLVAVHGQSDQQRLLRPARQREALDRYAGAGVLVPLERYREDYARCKELDADLAELDARSQQRAQAADLLRLGLAEIQRVAPQPGEDVALAAEAERLDHAEELRGAAAMAHDALLGDSLAGHSQGPDAIGLVGVARQSLEAVRGHDPELAALADRLAEAAYLLSDVGSDLASYAAGVETDPVRLAAVQDRRADLLTLTRRHGGSSRDRASKDSGRLKDSGSSKDTASSDDVLAWAERAGLRLLELESDDERTATLRTQRDILFAGLHTLALEIGAARVAAARRFGAEVTAELVDLAMPHATLTVDVRSADPSDEAAYGPHGLDTIELQLAAHPGAPLRPLALGASGGELSRVMLAVEVVFAGADPVPTSVFDEVDAGVGGRAAVEVGARLARLARTTQVLVVTHLPQVAAYADQHLLVAKASDGSVTRAGVTRLDGEARVRELTRMLAGLDGSATGAAHARELLDSASAAKGGSGPG